MSTIQQLDFTAAGSEEAAARPKQCAFTAVASRLSRVSLLYAQQITCVFLKIFRRLKDRTVLLMRVG